jgi:hypothetical protein
MRIAAIPPVLIATLVVGSAVNSQTATAGGAATGNAAKPANSGAGVQGLPGNKSGPSVKASSQASPGRSTTAPDQSGVRGLPGSKAGPTVKPPGR